LERGFQRYCTDIKLRQKLEVLVLAYFPGVLSRPPGGPIMVCFEATSLPYDISCTSICNMTWPFLYLQYRKLRSPYQQVGRQEWDPSLIVPSMLKIKIGLNRRRMQGRAYTIRLLYSITNCLIRSKLARSGRFQASRRIRTECKYFDSL
jgi:hypothetical protein